MDDITPVVLSVGTTHPFNIAGAGLAIRVGPLLGVRVITVIAGTSAQSATAVLARRAVDSALIEAQFAALSGLRVGAVHVGSLLDARSVDAVAAAVKAFDAPIVCDPVIASSGGGRLADAKTIAALRDHLFPHCAVVTPNLDEAELLVHRTVRALPEMEAAGRDLLAGGARAILVKGGHLDGDVTDVLVEKTTVTHFRATRVAAALRGTGDLLASALAARLAHGDALSEAVQAARAFVREHIATGVLFAGTRTLRV